MGCRTYGQRDSGKWVSHPTCKLITESRIWSLRQQQFEICHVDVAMRQLIWGRYFVSTWDSSAALQYYLAWLISRYHCLASDLVLCNFYVVSSQILTVHFTDHSDCDSLSVSSALKLYSVIHHNELVARVKCKRCEFKVGRATRTCEWLVIERVNRCDNESRRIRAKNFGLY